MTSHRDIPGSLLAMLGCLAIVQTAYGAAPVAADEIRGTVMSARGPEAGVWVIAETHDFQNDSPRSSSPTMPAAISSGFAEGEVQRLGTRLWSRGLSQVRRDAGTRIGYQGAHGQGCGDGGDNLSGRLLVRDDENSRGGAGCCARGRPQRLSHVDEEHGLCRLPSAGKSGDAYHPRVLRLVQVIAGGMAAAPPVGPGGRPDDQHRAGHAGRNSNSLSGGLTDRIAAGEVPAAQPARPSALSATSSPRCATGRTARPTCTICREPIGATRASTPMAGCTAPRN